MFAVLRDLLDDHPFNYSSNSSLLPGLYLDSSPRFQFHVARPRLLTTLTSGSKTDPNKYQVMLNVKHFRPEEIDVKIVDRSVVIHGKHEEHADEHGFVSREFSRRYQLPDDVEPDTVKSSLGPNGVLTIEAPRKQLEPPPKNERIVPITIQQQAAVEEAQKQQQQQQQLQDQQAAQQESTETQ